MPDANLYVGATVKISGTHQRQDRYHLCIILTNPSKENRGVLYVPIITYRSKFDDTCTLEVGDHPFINRKSCVDYAKIELRPESQLLNRSTGSLQEPLSSRVLNRVKEGIFASQFTKPWVIKDYGKVLKPNS